MRNRFDRELFELNGDLVKMGTLVENAIENAILALKDQDEAAFSKVAEYEDETNNLEREIESKALKILLCQQPVAKDLRLISTALKLITDMERISDQAFDISEIALHFRGKVFIKQPIHIIAMAEKAIEMVNGAVNAFVTQDEKMANDVISSDDEVDELFVTVRDELVHLIQENRDNGEQAIDFMMIAKYLERIADHAVNIAEWVIFNITGKHKNHRII